MDDCLSCTRPNTGTPCHFVHRKKSCESFVTTGGLEHIKDYFKANKECKDDYCGKFNQHDLTSQQVCRLCTDNEHCVFKTSDVKECISRDKAGEDNLMPSDYYEHPMDCQEDCSLAFTPGLTIFEGCVNCLQGRGSCSFYLNGHCMNGPDFKCARRKPYNFGDCPPITELINCSSVCKPEPMPPGPPPPPPSTTQPPCHRNPPSSTSHNSTPIPPHQPPLIRLAPPEPIEFPFNF
ncbi:hypothetical protein Ocin01_16892 [Orchesella cincta]|uniref:Uncharacterized protein n=1 Tax=Orchesella cincta TaxID=48709 RepID=A0A1D2M9Y7_ORCCI|nr:hypothetical protein Ocin01_16892 [Orchesella cincta]